jgi:hypothetical protein
MKNPESNPSEVVRCENDFLAYKKAITELDFFSKLTAAQQEILEADFFQIKFT